MTDEGVYKLIEVIGSSATSFEDAVQVAITEAGKSIKDLRVAEVEKFDVKIADNKIIRYRAKVKLSFKIKAD